MTPTQAKAYLTLMYNIQPTDYQISMLVMFGKVALND